MSKIILITGASSGFGKQTAGKLLQLGYTVYPAARRLQQMEDLKALGGHPLNLDVIRRARPPSAQPTSPAPPT